MGDTGIIVQIFQCDNMILATVFHLQFTINYISLHAAVRVATNLENLEKSGNLKETSESQGICQKSQGILLCEIHFQPSWRS